MTIVPMLDNGPNPSLDLQNIKVSDIQNVREVDVPAKYNNSCIAVRTPLTDGPNRLLVLYPLSPSPAPTTVNLVDPVVGPLVVAAELTTALS